MSLADDESAVLRRHFVAIATAEYADASWPALPGVRDEVRAMADWLCSAELGDRRFQQAFGKLAHSPSERRIRRALQRPPGETWTDADAAVLFVTGHGATGDGTHYLVLRKTDHRALPATALRTSELIGWLATTGVRHLVVILDVCLAGKVAEDVLRFDRELPPTWLILPSATRNQEAVLGALTTAITDFLARLKSDAGRKYSVGRYLKVETFLAAIQGALDEKQQRVEPLMGSQTHGEHLCLPNPHYDPERTWSSDELAGHWGPRARGVRQDHEPGWLFTGRTELMAELVRAATGPAGATVVSGRTGSGKSAVLARLVTLSNRRYRKRYARDLAVDVGPLPPLGAVDVAVLARGKLHTEVLDEICAAVEVPGAAGWGSAVTSRQRLDAFHAWLLDHGPVTVVVDALDEGTNPDALVELLAGLEPNPAVPRIRLLVGVRSPGGDGASARPGARASALADLAERRLRAARIRVDEAPWWAADDIVRYVESILLNTAGSPYREVGTEVTATVARAVGERVERSFLLATLAAGSLASRPVATTADDPDWLATLDQGLIGVFRDDLHHSLPPGDDDRREATLWRAVTLLRAIAFARGGGLPWWRIWPRVAAAIDDQGEYGDRDITWLLESRLGGYLLNTPDDDVPAYRFFHDSLANALRRSWRQLLCDLPTGRQAAEPAHESTAEELRATEALITRALSRSTDLGSTAGRGSVPGYLRRHLVEHAGAAGLLDDDHVPASFLAYVEPTRLHEAVSAAAATRPPHAGLSLLSVVRQVTHLWDWTDPAYNASAIQMWAALNGLPLPAPTTSPWWVRWAVRRPDQSVILGRHTGAVWAVATAALPDGRVTAIAGSAEPCLSVWELSSGGRTDGPPAGREHAVMAAATATLPDGRVVVITAGQDEAAARVWDLHTGAPVDPPLRGHDRPVVAVATATLPDGRVIAVTGSEDTTARVWDLHTGAPVGPPLRGHDRPVVAVATATLPDGRVIAVTGAADPGVWLNDRTLWLWDLVSGAGEAFADESGGVTAATTTTLPDKRVVAVTGGVDSSVRVWDLARAGPAGAALTGHSGTLLSVAATTVAGVPTVITGSRDGSVRMWDLADLPVGVVPGDHATGTVEALATGTLADGRPVAVATGADSSLRVWDLLAGTPIGEPLAGMGSDVLAADVASLPDGRVVLVAGAWNAKVWIWDLAAGEPLHGPLSGHRGAVNSVSTVLLPGGRLVAVTGGWDASVRVWDVASGAPMGEPFAGRVDGAVAVATATLPDGRAVAVIGRGDGTTLLWDLTTRRPVGNPLPGHAGGVVAVWTATLPDGRVVAVTGGQDGTARSWDLAARAGIGRPLDGHTGGVVAVAITTLTDGHPVVVTAAEDPAVRVWDLDSGVPLGAPLPTPGPVYALAPHTVDRQPWLVVGGAGIAVARLRHGRS